MEHKHISTPCIKRRKRGIRSFFSRRKNKERQKQCSEESRFGQGLLQAAPLVTSEELYEFSQSLSQSQVLPAPIEDVSAAMPQLGAQDPAAGTNLMRPQPTLPEQWEVLTNGAGNCTYYKLQLSESGMCHIVASIVMHPNNSWSLYFHSKVVPSTSLLLSRFSKHALTHNDVMELIETVNRGSLCEGNPERKFVDFCRDKRGGVVRGERGTGPVVAYVDEVTATNGDTPSCTVRSTVCDIITAAGPCKVCRDLRTTLRSGLSRQYHHNNDERTQARSHTPYCKLTPAEKDARLGNLHHSLRVAELKNRYISINFSYSYILIIYNTALVSEVAPLVETRFAMSTPQRIFWEQQVKYNNLKEKRQMRWHPFVFRFALNLKYLSTSAYKAMRRSGIINLPSERTLSDYTHWMKPHTGVQLEFIEDFDRMLADVPCGQRHCAVTMDEMKIKSGLVFDKHNGTLVGFIDLGEVNRDIERAITDDEVCR